MSRGQRNPFSHNSDTKCVLLSGIYWSTIWIILWELVDISRSFLFLHQSEKTKFETSWPPQITSNEWNATEKKLISVFESGSFKAVALNEWIKEGRWGLNKQWQELKEHVRVTETQDQLQVGVAGLSVSQTADRTFIFGCCKPIRFDFFGRTLLTGQVT